jgi:hypothetical protein
MRRSFVLFWFLLVLALIVPGAAAAAGPPPGDACVPGTVWEDRASGVKWICIYDEAYGGSRWELLTGGQRWNQAWLARSSATGCALGTAAITSLGGSGADAIVRSFRWPCATIADRTYQPAGELRVRVVIQRYSGGWRICRDSGYWYSTTSATGWLTGIDMGSAADCGIGSYRAWGFGALYQRGAWRGSSLLTPALYLR